MNRADERALAWALADTAGPRLSVEARVRLNMEIGAGELDVAITNLMAFYGRTGTAIPRDLAVALNAWIFGYTGSPAEAHLHQLVNRIPLQSADVQRRLLAKPALRSARVDSRIS
jgi:hypothetical protein